MLKNRVQLETRTHRVASLSRSESLCEFRFRGPTSQDLRVLFDPTSEELTERDGFPGSVNLYRGFPRRALLKKYCLKSPAVVKTFALDRGCAT
jgi:hypothetical protein